MNQAPLADFIHLTIHRAAAQIGGNCVELRCGEDRLILDAGLPLDALDVADAPLPATLDLGGQATVIISHPHLDHYGLIHRLPPTWPIWCGAAAASLIDLSGRIGRRPLRTPLHTWQHRRSFTIGPFRITPMLTDHSAFDASMLLIDVAGRRILYTGDFRMHGRKEALVRRLMARPPANLDVLLMEGTTLGRTGEIPSEANLEQRFVELFQHVPGKVFVAWAGTNVDRTTTLARACLKAKRPLVVDIYSADVLQRLAPWSPKLPQPGRAPIRTVITRRLAARYRRDGEGDLIDRLAGTGLSARRLRHVPNAVVMVRTSLIPDYHAAGVIPSVDDAWCWSQWRGYLTTPRGQELAAWFATGDCPACHLHTSGHAAPEDLHSFSTAMQPRWLVPIHGEHWDDPQPGFPGLLRLRDGQTWSLPAA